MPKGAITTVGGLEELLVKARAGETVVVYETWGNRIEKLIISSAQHPYDINCVKMIDESGNLVSLYPYLRHVQGCHGTGPRSSKYWFSNYWYAYAHTLKKKKGLIHD